MRDDSQLLKDHREPARRTGGVDARPIRFPTVNPPGEAYRPCAEYLGERLKRRGFAVEYVRARRARRATSDRYPRINVIARRESARPGPACISTATSMWCRRGAAGRSIPLPRRGQGRQGIWPRRLRHERRPRRRRHRRRGADRFGCSELPGALEISGTVDEESGGYGGVALSGRARLVLAASRRSRDHPRALECRPGLHRPSRRVVGRDRDPWAPRAWLDALSRRLRGPPHERGARTIRARSVSRTGAAAHRHAGGAERRAPLHHEHQFGPRRRGGSSSGSARALRARFLPHGDRPALADRRGLATV